MAYASRAIALYQGAARTQQIQLLGMKAPLDRAAASDFWALNTVGTGYFIIGDSWMLMSYDFRGAELASGLWQRALQWADLYESQVTFPAGGSQTYPTNAAGCLFYAQRVFASLHDQYPY